MIRQLTGTVVFAERPIFIVDVAGVGYEVLSETIKASAQEKLTCAIYTSVKEDSLTLFGFNNEQERGLFILLLSVNGVGPKSALHILGELGPQAISNALAQADPAPFRQVKGIGKKVAERLVLDLSGSINRLSAEPAGSLDIASALENLGYTRREYQTLLKELPAGDTAQQLSWALSQLAGQR